MQYDVYMPKTPCAVAGCDRSARFDGWCPAHYRRWQRTGDVKASKPIRTARRVCSVPECDNDHFGHDLCQKHYYRWQRNGHPKAKKRRSPGAGSIATNGYMRITKHGHPLADSRGSVSEHRVVLFDTIGPGEHRCHWCQTPVYWDIQEGQGLVVDHVDGDKLNNIPENLVPACQPCNAHRRFVTCDNCGHKQRC